MNELKLASISDIDEIMTIISDAKAYLKKQGLKQWNLPDGYPNKSDLINDINQNECYIYLIDNTIIGVMVIMEKPDENYNEIDGKWLTSNKYASIHRIAVRMNYHNQQIGIKMLLAAEDIIKNKNIYSIKIDTHKQNIPMLKTLDHLNYTYSGIIKLKRSNEDNLRLAYEKIIK
jgi:ribosomal protein S18 acetylase RimI-like enzyme